MRVWFDWYTEPAVVLFPEVNGIQWYAVAQVWTCGCRGEGVVLTNETGAVNFKSLLYADVAQLVEQRTCNARVGGSNPFIGSFPKYT